MKIRRSLICNILIILFHAVGLIGLLAPASKDIFLKLVPFHLLLMALLLIVSQSDKSNDFWLFVVITYLAGFTIELIGTHTGLIFGEYAYGKTLGTKFSGVPLVIGINWVILIYSVGILIRKMGMRSLTKNSLFGGLLLTILDILIEPVAIKFDYWRWIEMDIPFQNYVAWFIFSTILLRFFYALDFRKRNSSGVVMIVTQFIFFITLNLTAF